jgi:adenosine deaminase
MPRFDVEAERINVFPVGDEYLFTHYFDRKNVFNELREYYNGSEYRFEIPEEDFDEVSEFLKEQYFKPVVVEDLKQFSVVKETYTEHAEILKNSVANWERRNHRFFLMKDELSVKEAVEQGATKIEDTDFALGL